MRGKNGTNREERQELEYKGRPFITLPIHGHSISALIMVDGFLSVCRAFV